MVKHSLHGHLNRCSEFYALQLSRPCRRLGLVAVRCVQAGWLEVFSGWSYVKTTRFFSTEYVCAKTANFEECIGRCTHQAYHQVKKAPHLLSRLFLLNIMRSYCPSPLLFSLNKGMRTHGDEFRPRKKKGHRNGFSSFENFQIDIGRAIPWNYKKSICLEPTRCLINVWPRGGRTRECPSDELLVQTAVWRLPHPLLVPIKILAAI